MKKAVQRFLFPMFRKVLFLITCAAIQSSCTLFILDDLNALKNPLTHMIIVVQDDLYPYLEDEIEMFQADLDQAGTETDLLIRPSGSISELRSLLKEYTGITEAALLIGEFPSVTYEMIDSARMYESFPTDIYFMDPDSVWFDKDNDGRLDGHGIINLEIPVSRLIGTTAELKHYFDKNHRFRTEGFIEPNAYIFKDDDWFNYDRGSAFGLERIFDDIDIEESSENTRKSNYINKLSSGRSQYVYQWIHANPQNLYIANQGTYEIVTASELENRTLQAHFFNMFNCKGARFTEPNLGMTYLMKSEYGLAVTGSTKVGGNYNPLEFHRILKLGGTWGKAFQGWYNSYGKFDDEWFLGMVLLGDPSLGFYGIKDSDEAAGFSASMHNILPPQKEKLEELRNRMHYFAEQEQ